MLVLSRRLNEKIVLPDLDITIQIIALKSGAVRIGIDAPPDLVVLREELLPQHTQERSTVAAAPFRTNGANLQPCFA